MQHLLTVASRRTYVEKGTARFRTDAKELEKSSINRMWLTTPWHIFSLPWLISLVSRFCYYVNGAFSKKGILPRGVAGVYMPEFYLEKPIAHYFASPEWSGIIGKWDGYVRAVVERK